MSKKVLGYAGITFAGFLLNFVCIGICVGIIALVVEYLESWVVLYVFPPLLICAGIGAIHRIFRRTIRGRLHMKTTVYSLVSHGIPMIGGVVGIILGISGTLQTQIRFYCFIIGLAVFVEAMFCGLFGVTFDRLFNSSFDKRKPKPDSAAKL